MDDEGASSFDGPECLLSTSFQPSRARSGPLALSSCGREAPRLASLSRGRDQSMFSRTDGAASTPPTTERRIPRFMSSTPISATSWIGQRLARAVATVAASGLLVGGLVLDASATVASAETAPLAASVPAATVSTVSLPRAARAEGAIADWTLAGPETVAEVWPEVGGTKSGSIALGIDAPVVPSTRTAASVQVPVQPATTYTFEAYVRVMSKTAKSVPAWFAIGGTAIVLPKLNASWKLVTGTFTSGAEASSATLAVRVSKALRGLSIDGVKLYAAADTAKTNLVPNGSFETVTAKRGIVSTSLIMTTPTAAVAVALPAGRITWAVTRSGKTIKSGSLTRAGAITAISLSGVPQGYYTFKVRASDGRLTSTPIAIVDSPNPWIAPDARFGVGLHVENATYADAARHARVLGISEVRNDMYWGIIEKTKGVYDFSVYEAPFTRARLQGLKILGIAGYGNSIYGASNAYAPRTSAAVSAYGKYAAAIAKRFNLVGLEVYNEFNHAPKNKSNCTSAACYLPILKSVSTAVGKVKPSLPIVAGATARYPATWFRDLWKKGGLRYADAMSFHPYEITGKPEGLASIVTTARKSMKTYGGTTKPVWITELGTSSRTGNRTTTEQASLLVRAAISGFSTGARKYYWYDLINDTPRLTDQEGNFGLYSHPTAALAAVAPKPAAFAQALTITQLGGRAFRANEKLGTGVVSTAFGTSTNLVRVVWAPTGTKTATIRTSKPVVVVDFTGAKRTVKPKNGVVKIAVTKNPVFVRSGSATAGVTR
ncbi:glycosyl hydrolase [Microbacterium sp. PA5]|uniref:glycosyl hydrolase n=1 Tax=Microbacterium sp. PA5 TaxID=3416654 RepID=UPI003CEA5564